ncbi:MAG: ABC transporter ATP-binding protein, partial [Taibaiella sp.]|nr:ABC transporter ATP-binding protein [Taibaiella sp.]
GNKLEAPAAQLSAGEQQRVAIVRALSQPFEWLLLDEPFSHLDFFNRQKAVALIKEVAGYTRAGIIVTSVAMNEDFVYDKKMLL